MLFRGGFGMSVEVTTPTETESPSGRDTSSMRKRVKFFGVHDRIEVLCRVRDQSSGMVRLGVGNVDLAVFLIFVALFVDFQPQRGVLGQPRATPWEFDTN
jgi:hypothetical protein